MRGLRGAVARVATAALAVASAFAGCGDDGVVLECPELGIGDNGQLVVRYVTRYDVDALNVAIAERPEAMAVLGFTEVTTCPQAEAASRYLSDEP
jgi:hypothetical protein